jgi:hypothetical protein
MQKFLALLMAACASFSALADDVTLDEKGWIKAVQPYYVEAKAANIDSIVGLIADPQSGDSPVSMMFKQREQQCVFLVASRKNFASQYLQDLMNTSGGREVARAAAVAHEYGHCIHNIRLAQKWPGSEALPPAKNPVSESIADVFALAWFAKNRPEDFEQALQFMRRLRDMRGQGKLYEDAYAFVNKAANLRELMAARPADPFDYAVHIVMKLPLPDAPAQTAMTAPVLTAKAE